MTLTNKKNDRVSPLRSRLKDVENPCAQLMNPRFVEYVENESIIYDFPVLAIYLNPWKSMQGGLISAAFDNAFGALALLAADKTSVTTIDLNVSYHRPIYGGDSLMVKVYLKAKGKNIITMWGEAFNREERLVATATSKLLILHIESEKSEFNM